MSGIPRTAGWGLALAAGTALISGFSIWVNASGVRQVPDPALYTTLKNGVAAAIVLAALAATGAGAVRVVARRDWLRLGLIGAIGGSLPFLLFFSGLAQATAPGAAFIHKTMFVWVALLAVPLLHERLGWLQVIAIGMLLGGQILLVPPDVGGATAGSGEILIASATLLWAVEVILAKRTLVTVPPLVVGAARLGIGFLILAAYVAGTGSLPAVMALPAAAWGWVVLTGILLAAYVATWLAALRRAPASAVTSVLVVGAAITALLQSIDSGTIPASGALLGGVLLLVAAALVAAAALRPLPGRTITTAASDG